VEVEARDWKAVAGAKVEAEAFQIERPHSNQKVMEREWDSDLYVRCQCVRKNDFAMQKIFYREGDTKDDEALQYLRQCDQFDKK
jgi:hypothetical protein